MNLTLLIPILLFSCLTSCAADYYVAANGTSPEGTLDNPMSLSFALSSAGPAQPGDSIMLRGGYYNGAFSSRLLGHSNNPIVVKPYGNEKATLNGTNETVFVPVLSIGGSGTWFVGLEVSMSVSNRFTSNMMGGVLFDVPGSDNKLINCVIHDTGTGVFISGASTNAEVTGCVIYNNGWQGTDREHGHGVYPQNYRGNRKLIRDNIIFHQFGYGIHAYGESGHVDELDIVGNIVFENGYLSASRTENPGLLIQTKSFPSVGNVVSENIFYNSYSGGTIPICLIGNQTPEVSVTIRSNVFVNAHLRLSWVTNATVLDNTFENWNLQYRYCWDWYYPSRSNPFVWDRNHYWNYQSIILVIQGGGIFDFNQWRAAYPNYDVHGDFNGPATNQTVYIRQNPYDANRINIVVVNPSGQDSALVDLGNRVNAGDHYEVRNASDYFGAVVKKGVYHGSKIVLPVTNLTSATPVGFGSLPIRTPLFNAFVLTRTPPPRMKHLRADRQSLNLLRIQ